KMKDELFEIGNKALTELNKRGIKEAIILVRSINEVMIKLANTQPSIIQNWRRIILSMRIAKEKRLLITETEISELEKLPKFIERMLLGIEKVKESEFYAPLPEPVDVKPLTNIVDKNIIYFMENPGKLTNTLIDEALNYGVDKIAGTIDLIYGEKVLLTSKGAQIYEDTTGVTVYLRAFKNENSGHWAWSSKFINLSEVRNVARKSSEYATLKLPQIKFIPGKYDVILSPLVSGNLFNVISHMASAFATLVGFSMFIKKKLGDKIASDIFTVIDEPRNRNLYRSTAFDDEGIPTFSKPIIENGVFKTLLHNNATALRMKTKTTGNAGWISPEPWNLIIPTGTFSEEELIQEVKRGILISNNWYTRLQNYVEGIFSTVSRDATI
ncbi:MAG TPA: TldD/PmbA family protein, partial [Chromatiaceae bacterium]|nr:TldD/PmbA family protein [Chromatiaceae bacterium]